MYNYGNAYPINQKRINPHTSEERTSDTQSESSLDLFRIELKSILLLKSLDKELQDEKKIFSASKPNPFRLHRFTQELFKVRLEAYEKYSLEILMLQKDFKRRLVLGMLAESIQKKHPSRPIIESLTIPTIKKDYQTNREQIYKEYKNTLSQISAQVAHSNQPFQFRILNREGIEWRGCWIENERQKKRELAEKQKEKCRFKPMEQKLVELIQKNKAQLQKFQEEHSLQCNLLQEIQAEALGEEMSSEIASGLERTFSRFFKMLKKKQGWQYCQLEAQYKKSLKKFYESQGLVLQGEEVVEGSKSSSSSGSYKAKRARLELADTATITSLSSSPAPPSLSLPPKEMFVSEQIEYPECSSQERQTLVSEGTSSKVDLATMRMIEQQQIQQGEFSSSLKHIEPYDYHTSPILGDQSRKQDDMDDSSSESSEGSLVIDEGAVSGSSSPVLSLEMPSLEGEENMEEVNAPILSGRDVISSSSQLQPTTTEESRKQPFSVIVHPEGLQVSQEQSYHQQEQQVSVKSQRPSVIQFVSSVPQQVMSSVLGYIEKSSGETASSKDKEVKEKDQSSMSLEQGEQLASISSCEQLQVTEACVVQEEER